ncbi:MAG: hypothetical protein ACRYGP_16560 [Janthinobacterium lividum]
MPDTPATPAPAPAATVPAAPAPISAPATGETLISVKGLRPVLDPGDASPLGHPDGATPAPVPTGAVIEGAAS